MNFTAPAFVLLFPIVLALHWMLPPSRRWVLLLAASLGFYAVGSPQALPLLAGITLGTYAAALGIAKSKTQTAKKLWLTCAAVLCIGCLCLFKYAGIFRTDVPLLLPAGISFYTFQTLSYVIDIYRGRLMPERHPGYYALFVSFFPQLVAGPIERSTALLPQLHAQERRMDSSGWLWMVRGFAKKLLLADTAAVFVDSVYASPADASGPAVLLATLLFAGQIYWDFSGYSDIAVGAAALLGVRLSRNFDHPYRADSLRDFWRRWHISLTRWFTDYVYIPLGGSRRGTARLAVNAMVVFLLSGLLAWRRIAFCGVGRCAWCAAAFGKGPDPLRRKAQGPHPDRRVPAPRLYIFSGLRRLGLFPGSLCLGCPSAAVPPACRLVAEHTAYNAAEHRYTAGGRACFGGALPASAARDVVRSTVPAQRIGLLSFGIDCGRRVVFHTAHGHDQCLYLLPILTLP